MKIDTLILSVTDDCNLACRYCFVQHKPEYMTLDIAKRSIDYFIQINADNDKELTVLFFGGEPTLQWDTIIVPIVDYCKNFNKKIKFSITTNGTLLNIDRLKYMKENNFNMLLSFDGNKKTQNFNRPYKDGSGSFDTVIKNLPDILSFYPDITARGTIYPETAKYLIDNIMFFNSLGIQRCFFTPDTFSDWSEEQIAEIKLAIRKYSIYFIDAYRTDKRIIQLNPIINGFNEYFYTGEGNCGLGIGSITINAKGEIFTCQELSSYHKEDNPYQVGDIFTGIDEEKVIGLMKQICNIEPECEDKGYCENECGIRDRCGNHFCHVNCFLQNGKLSGKKKKIICMWDSLILETSLFIKNILILNKNYRFINEFIKGGSK